MKSRLPAPLLGYGDRTIVDIDEGFGCRTASTGRQRSSACSERPQIRSWAIGAEDGEDPGGPVDLV